MAPSQSTAFRIPWAQPYLDDEEVAAVVKLLRERRLSMGAEVAGFERECAEVACRAEAIAVANGTVALDVALKLLAVGEGDEVLVSGLSYIATTNSIVEVGATPVFCDVDPRTLNIDAADAARRVTARTRVLMVADYCGAPADYGALEQLCRDAGIDLVVDGAQSIGATYNGAPTWSKGVVATTSFHTAKAVVCGEGGMVFVDDPDLARRARRLRGQGEIPGRKYVHDTLASNYRMSDLVAAIGRVQLARLDEVVRRRNEIAARYLEQLADVGGVRLVERLAGTASAWFSFPVLAQNRESLVTALDAGGIETRSLYAVPAYRQPIPEYSCFRDVVLPVVEAAAAEILNLPVFFELGTTDIDLIANTLRGAAVRC